MLIDRVEYLDRQLSHTLNRDILFHLRQALVLHEARALQRKVALGKLRPEQVSLGTDGHFRLTLD